MQIDKLFLGQVYDTNKGGDFWCARKLHPSPDNVGLKGGRG